MSRSGLRWPGDVASVLGEVAGGVSKLPYQPPASACGRLPETGASTYPIPSGSRLRTRWTAS
ncbi:hypothetical protein AB0C84_45935, partial [Actinomadura sp. NPDC048955]|uniref:hypothetical protein n=1 Tax=Actinomadura sp. NPDC048955 TaxID=3158228 RepID=UPI0033FD8BA6